MKIKKQKQKGVGSNKDSPFILLDADIVVYSCASAADGKFYKIEGIEGKYPLIKDVKKAFEKAGIKYDRKIVHEDYEPDPIDHCLHSVRLMTESIIEGAGNGPYQLVLTGKGNYRDKETSIQPYKGNRFTSKQREALRKSGQFLDWLDKTEEKFTEPRKPFHLASCREYLIKKWGAIVVDGEECDDYLGWNQTEDTIIATIDKDLDTIKGKHYRWPNQGNEGYLYEVSEIESDRNLYKQLLVGDTTDNIAGLKGVGKKSPFMKVIDELTDPRAMAEYCFDKYFDYELLLHCDKPLHVLKKVAYSKYLETGRLVYIRREENELWSPPRKKD